MVFLGNPEYGVELQPIDFAAYARTCDASGFAIEDPADYGAILDRALATPGPVVVEAVVDPYEPPRDPGQIAAIGICLSVSSLGGRPPKTSARDGAQRVKRAAARHLNCLML